MPSKEELLAWAAGIYEGEGDTTKNHPIRVAQKDTWILYKLQEMYGGSVYKYDRREGGYIHRWVLLGEAGRNLLKLFMPYLSPRRLKQIEDSDVFSILKRKNACRKGHEFTPDNTRWLSDGSRTCRICSKIRERGRYVA